MLDECKSCDMCQHEFEAKPERTPGEKWAGIGQKGTCGTVICQFAGDRECGNCRRVQAKAYDLGRASRDKEVGLIMEQADFLDRELDKVDAKQPKPAMTYKEYKKSGDRAGWGTQTASLTSAVNNMEDFRTLPERIVDDYRKLNKGCVIT